MFEAAGFRFDMGPSWYWMTDVMEAFFNRFGLSVADCYILKHLDPLYAVYFSHDHSMRVPAQPEACMQLLETYEIGIT